jgi:acyl carrier protein
MEVDWARYCADPGAGLVPFVRDLPDTRQHTQAPAATAAAVTAAAGGEGELGRRLAGTGRAGQLQLLLEVVRAGAAQILGHDSAEQVPTGRPFSDLGFDSLTALELSQYLARETGLRVPATMVFDYPTPSALAACLRSRLFPAVEDGGADAGEAVIRRALADVPLAQLRAAGVMDILLKLAGLHDAAGAAAVSSRIDSIDDMDAESLIEMALGDDDRDSDR